MPMFSGCILDVALGGKKGTITVDRAGCAAQLSSTSRTFLLCRGMSRSSSNEPPGEHVTGHPGFGVVPVAHGHVIAEATWLPSLPDDKGQASSLLAHRSTVTCSLLFLPPVHVPPFKACKIGTMKKLQRFGANVNSAKPTLGHCKSGAN